MITPLGQRQMFQNLNSEAVRAALETHGQFQRELMQAQVLANRTAEDQVSVPEIPEGEAARTEERKEGRGKGEPEPQDGKGEGEEHPEGAGAEAKPAEVHMDFLA